MKGFVYFLSSIFYHLTSLFFTFYLLLPTFAYAQTGWGPDVRLTYYIRGTAYLPKIAVSGDTIHVVWYEDINNQYLVMYKRSTDRGETWTPDTILSPVPPGASKMPDIAVSGSVVHVAWTEEVGDSILYTRSTNSGREWDIPKTLSSAGFVVNVSVSGDSVIVYWGTTTASYLSMSTDAGLSWLPAQRIPKERASMSDDIAICLPYLHLAYQDVSTGPPVEIYYQRSSDVGQTWSLPLMVSEDDIWGGQRASIAVDNDANIYIDWWDYKNSPYAWTGSIFLRKGVNNSTNWDTIQNLTTLYRAKISDIAVQGNNVHIVWMDQRDYPGSPFDSFEIYYRYSSDRGNTWGPETRLTYDPHQSTDPRLAADSNFVYLVWTDDRDLDSSFYLNEIYFKRGYIEADIKLENDILSAPQTFQVFPSISWGTVRCYCDLIKSQVWSLDVFDIMGRKVWHYTGSGKRVDLVWGYKDKSGKEVRNGVYFIMLRTGRNSYQRKVIFLKGG